MTQNVDNECKALNNYRSFTHIHVIHHLFPLQYKRECSRKMETVQNIKCVIIGSKSVGKTTLLNSYVTSPSSSSIRPFDNYNGIKVQIEEDNQIYQLELWDTNCADHHKIIRKNGYENCDIVLVCFSVMDHESLRDVKKKVSAGKTSCNIFLIAVFVVDTRSKKMLPADAFHSDWNKN